ncbi:MAG TPA: tetratricopeptide repeat protein [Rhizomicrobium sp.]|nr:tetratricopeptide repeat protein [Rhizomicrobium sp.]
MSAPQLRASDPYETGLALSAKGHHVEAIEQFERALGLAPDDPRVLFALGNTARDLGLSAAAEEFYTRVLAQEPQRLEVLVNLANLLRAGGKAREAVARLEPFVGRLGDAPELWLALGAAYRDMGSTEDAEENFREALAHRPDYAPALCNLADILADRGQTDEALALYDRALKRDPKNPQARLNRAILNLLAGRLKEGWRDYAGRLELAGKAPKTDHGLPRWAGGSLKRTRLLVTAEQGVGDHLLFASLFPELIEKARAEGGSIVLDCDPRLVTLFARSFPLATVRPQQSRTIGTVTTAQYGWLKACGGANQATEMGTLPHFLRNDLSAFPAPHRFLKADEAETGLWQQAFGAVGTGPFIGICWRSGKLTGARGLQYAPLEAWADFLRALPGTIVSVQYDAARDEVEKLEALSGRQILMPDGIDQKNELDRTCALLCALDAVVSAPTAVSWLSAGAGVPTFKVLYDRSWTSFGLDHEPFAPAATCVRPEFPGDWVGAFATARNAMRARFAG